MSEWKRHRGSKSMPKCLVGKKFEARLRDGTLTDGEYITAWDHLCFDSDVMAYKILPSEPDAEPASKTAIELQAEEVGIPEPVQHVAGEWIEWKGGDCPVPKGTLVDVRYCDGVESFGVMAGMTPWLDGDRVRGSHKTRYAADWEYQDGGTAITAYRLHQPQEWPKDRIDVIGQNGNDGLHYDAEAKPTKQLLQELKEHADKAAAAFDRGMQPTTAPQFLQSALSTLTQRGQDYDKPEGERSAAAVAVAFNAITGRNLTEAEVWLVLQLVKDVRQWQNPERYHTDSALDCVAYAALKAEALAGGSE